MGQRDKDKACKCAPCPCNRGSRSSHLVRAHEDDLLGPELDAAPSRRVTAALVAKQEHHEAAHRRGVEQLWLGALEKPLVRLQLVDGAGKERVDHLHGGGRHGKPVGV